MSKGLEALGRHVREELEREAPSASDAAARERFVRAAAKAPAKKSYARPIAAGVAIAAAAAAATFLIPRRSEVTPGYEAAGAVARVGVELTTSSSPLQFSDGSRVEMKNEAKVRVAALDAHGARLVLETGSAHFALAPKADADWTVSAGSFEVRGAGAKFELAFMVSTDEVDLAVEEGQVALSGSCVEKRAVSAPAHVHVSCGASLPPTQPTAAAPTATIDVRENAPPKSSLPVRLGWRALAAKSQWAEALAAALAGDFDRECDTDSAADLLALGDVARLAHDAPHARHAYETLRARFPGDPNAAVAAFSLGKLAFDEDHAHGEAGRAFDTYLREEPHGALARDALARSMEAHLRAGDRDTARTLAQRYLDQFPGGPREEVARGIVGK